MITVNFKNIVLLIVVSLVFSCGSDDNAPPKIVTPTSYDIIYTSPSGLIKIVILNENKEASEIISDMHKEAIESFIDSVESKYGFTNEELKEMYLNE